MNLEVRSQGHLGISHCAKTFQNKFTHIPKKTLSLKSTRLDGQPEGGMTRYQNYIDFANCCPAQQKGGEITTLGQVNVDLS